MVDRIVEEMLGCRVGDYLLSRRLNAFNAERKKIVEDGNADALRGVDAAIKKAETRRGVLMRRYQKLRNGMRANARRSAGYEDEARVSRLKIMQDFYLDAIEWLQNNRPADAKDEKETYWDRFVRSRPADEIWVV